MSIESAIDDVAEKYRTDATAMLRGLAKPACKDCITVNFSSTQTAEKSLANDIPLELVSPIYERRICTCEGRIMVVQTGCSHGVRGEEAPECGHPDRTTGNEVINGVKLGAEIANGVIEEALVMQVESQGKNE